MGPDDGADPSKNLGLLNFYVGDELYISYHIFWHFAGQIFTILLFKLAYNYIDRVKSTCESRPSEFKCGFIKDLGRGMHSSFNMRPTELM